MKADYNIENSYESSFFEPNSPPCCLPEQLKVFSFHLVLRSFFLHWKNHVQAGACTPPRSRKVLAAPFRELNLF